MTLSLEQLNASGRAEFTAALGHLFEHSSWVVEETWSRRPFRDAKHLHSELCLSMRAAVREKQLALIRAHPDLAGRLAAQNKLTAESAGEQASAGLDRLTDEELAAFQEKNDDYREKFGFPFVICARFNAKNTMLTAMDARLMNSPAVKRAAALGEIEKIAWLRLQDTLQK